MKQSTKKKTQSKKAKSQQEPVVFNGTLVGTWKNSDIYRITLDSGAMIVKYGSNEYKPGTDDIRNAKKACLKLAAAFGIDERKVVVINV